MLIQKVQCGAQKSAFFRKTLYSSEAKSETRLENMLSRMSEWELGYEKDVDLDLNPKIVNVH